MSWKTPEPFQKKDARLFGTTPLIGKQWRQLLATSRQELEDMLAV
jgi:hypothetical protein